MNSSQCTYTTWVCDGGNPDCRDGSDEDPDLCSSWLVTMCVYYWHEILNDYDNVDVITLCIVLRTIRCPKDYWQCMNTSKCIMSAWVCDGYTHCRDGSDESSDLCSSW